MSGSIRAHVVLVHGNFLGPWCWQEVADNLARSGVRATTVRLPSSTTSNGAPAGDLHDDAAHVRATVDLLDGPVVLCGHSYGGAVITEAAGGPHPAVGCLVYLTGAMPDVGESLASLAPTSESSDTEAGEESVRFRPDGMIELTPESAHASLFHDCTPTRADEAISQLAPSNPAVGSQSVHAAAWHNIPTTYVRGSLDRMPELISPNVPQESIEQIELTTGHCPNWSHPHVVSKLIATRAS